MPDRSNKITRFWNELKRRKVIYVITVYASAAFVIIELINNLAEPLNLPPNLLTIVVIVLAIGFPLVIILSWLYDLTSEGVEKTKPIKEIAEGEKTVVPNAWKIATYVSFVMIVGLAVLNFMGRDKKLHAGDIQSMVILPFHNYTGDDQLDYFVAGMHSSLIGDMGKVSGLRVLSETTSNIYKNAEKSIPEIASELRVDVVVEPTVTCFGDSICLQVKVFSAFPEEKLLWVTDYREDRRNILNLYNQITKQIAEEVKVELTDDEETLLASARTVNKDAYDNYLKGRFYYYRLSEDDLKKALGYFNRAIELDPGWAPPYAGLAMVYQGFIQMGFMPPSEAMIEIINKNLDKAIELDPDYPGSHFIKAGIGVWMEWDWEKGEREFLKALEINPNDVMSRIFYSHLLMILKRYDEAYFHSQMAVELDPMNPLVLALSANVDYHERIQQSLEKIKKALEIDPEHHFALLSFRDVSFFNGDYKNSIETELRMIPGLDDEDREAIMVVFQDRGYVEAINTMLTYLEEYASTNYMSPVIMGKNYYKLGNLDKAIEYYLKGYEIHDPNMPYFTDPMYGFNDIKDDPRIKSIVEEMNLPFEAQN